MSDSIIIDTGDLRFIEGHGQLVVKSYGGKIRAEFHNLEGPRFLTKYLRGKPVELAPRVASRICGLCYTVHSISSAEAVERALGMKISEDVRKLRDVLYMANNLRSHLIHLLFLSIPPVEGLISALRMRDLNIVRMGANILSKATELIEVWGGRSVHVPNVIVGGFGKAIKCKELLYPIHELATLSNDTERIVRYALNLELPEMERYRLMVALKRSGSYPIYAEEANIAFSDGSVLSSSEYYEGLEEVTKDYSTSKHVYFKESEITVGALSRIMLNKRYLSSRARELAEEVEWGPNPFLNIKAQAIEVLHYLDELIRLGGELAEIPAENLKPPEIRAHRDKGVGLFVAEAPRGTLCHYCEIEDWKIKDYRVYTPTAINSKSIENDAIELIKRFKPLGSQKLKFILEDMVRSYDPCLSCAVSLDIYD
ncbi:MAG: nickel-dependent hydrogenase large subunit [Candidatus Methanomethylicaceae archaeon]|nr:nickel-dependent hydrogenase large subunit [Candidatus Verstraetearchaeota archaeon]